MKNEERFKAAYRRIMENFNQPEEKLRGFFCDSIEKEHKRTDDFIKKFYEKFGGEKGTDLENILNDFETAMVSVAFSFGYVFGQMFDIPSPEIQKDLKAIKILMTEQKLLSYVPREREKSSSHHYDELGGPIDERRGP